MDFHIESNKSGSSRLITTIGNKKCPLGCIYCFTENENYTKLSNIDELMDSEDINNIIEDVDLIQPSTDVEFFLLPNPIQTLKSLSKHRKSISIATKSRISNKMAIDLSIINEDLMRDGSILQIAVSISRINDWQDIEKFTPSPEDRIKSLRNLFESGIPTTLALRPLLPFIEKDEIKQIVDISYKYCFAYITGPTYTTPALKDHMSSLKIETTFQQRKVLWMRETPEIETIHTPHLEEFLIEQANIYRIPVFDNNISTVAYLRNKFTKQAV